MRQLVALIALLSSSALASQPGQPVDCSDWEAAIPGITCSDEIPAPCVDENLDFLPGCNVGNPAAIDNQGATFSLRVVDTARVACPGGGCQTPCYVPSDAEIWAVLRGQETLVGRFRGRCGDPRGGSVDKLIWTSRCETSAPPRMLFDIYRGALLISVFSWCDAQSGNPSLSCPYGEQFGYNCKGSHHVIAIEGFATLFDTLQSFAPAPDQLGFRAPVMPEGMRDIDHFDTYWGAVTQPLDLAAARPLKCAYPMSPPSPGTYLAIDAPVPTPAPGQAHYVLTAATYQGERRAGRKRLSGQLAGRDASRLPLCTTE